MKKNRFRLLGWFKLHWKGFLTGLVIAALGLLTLGLQIDTLAEGQNRFETETLSKIDNFEYFKNNLVNAPYYLPAFGLGELIDDKLLAARIISVVYALSAAALLFIILKRWFLVRTAAIGSLLFITSAWLLSISHQAAPFILLVFIPLLLMNFLSSYNKSTNRAFIAFWFLALSFALAAYVPYMIYVVLAILIALLFVYKKDQPSKVNAEGNLLAAITMLILIAPLAYSLYVNPDQIKILLGVPEQLPSLTTYLSNFAMQFVGLFIYTERLPELFIYQKPLINIFSSVMLVLGIYHFYRHAPKRRSITFAIYLLVLLVVIPLQNEYLIAMTALIPFVFILIASGVHEIIRQWFYVFPRNPYAKTMAAILIVTVVGLSVTYNLQKYYIAWPNTPETQEAYMIKSNSN